MAYKGGEIPKQEEVTNNKCALEEKVCWISQIGDCLRAHSKQFQWYVRDREHAAVAQRWSKDQQWKQR